MSLIVFAIPVFFLLIGIEVLIDKLKKTGHYRFNDAVTNISCGIGQQITGVFMKTMVFVLYTGIFSISPLKGIIPHEWWVYPIAFIGVDFCYYWFHRLAHEISLIWGTHVVHHQSEEYNLTVALRQSWLQGAFSQLFYLPLAFIGLDPWIFFTLSSLNTLYQFWIHTKYIDKLPAPFEYLFNTPSHHRVHHGVNPKYIDRNHGGTLIMFDRMFGTFQAEEEEVVYGVTLQPKSWNPLWLNFEYWSWMIKQMGKARNLKDKLGILLREPGWMPEYIGGTHEAQPVTKETFVKYDTDIPNGLNWYVLIQYVFILGGTVLFLTNISREPYNSNLYLKLSGLFALIFAIVNLGGIFEKKRWSYFLELGRQLILPIGVYFVLTNNALSLNWLLPILLVSILSIVWLIPYTSLFKNAISKDA